MTNSWWRTEVCPKWLTLTFGQLIVGLTLGLITFFVIISFNQEELQLGIAIWLAAYFFDQGVRIVKGNNDKEED